MPQARDLKDRLLDAALAHVPFDGWGEATFRAAVAETGTDPAMARAACPKHATDLAAAFHRRGDARMAARLAETDLAEMRFRDRIAAAVRFRLEAVGDREVARRGAAHFALPQHAGVGAKLIWDTAGLIWETLGDNSDDINWYTKRATLSAVYGATLLYWLGDENEEQAATWQFLDRRIDDVMQVEKLKAQARENTVLQRVLAGPNRVLAKVRAPGAGAPAGLPGRWSGRG